MRQKHRRLNVIRKKTLEVISGTCPMSKSFRKELRYAARAKFWKTHLNKFVIYLSRENEGTERERGSGRWPAGICHVHKSYF